MHRQMNKVLYAVHGDGRLRPFDIQDTFDAQYRCTMSIQQHRQPDAEHGPVDGLVERESKGPNSIAMTVDIVVKRMVWMIMACRHFLSEPMTCEVALLGQGKQVVG
jgi:hypothetical protein